jgi:guanine nucleotide-binding protein G(I)/G(S)/G(T) subunit beta-1
MATIASNTNALQERLTAARRELTTLKQQLSKIKTSKFDGNLHDIYTQQQNDTSRLVPAPLNQFRSRRILRGHFGKIYSADWSGDSIHVASVSQDGKLMIWNALTTNKVQSIPLASSWIIACGFEKKSNQFVCCGGLDNICSIYKVGSSNSNRAIASLTGHTGYLSSFAFVEEKNIITGSGDSTAIYWDIETKKPLQRFVEHSADVMSISLSPQDTSIFATGSCDGTSRIWDIRVSKSVCTFHAHESDVNSVSFFPDGYAIGTGSDDATCRIFDIRCVNEIAYFGNEKLISGITGGQ